MSRIDKYLQQLEAQRRNSPVSKELWSEWKNHPMTQIFFLDHDISLIEEMMYDPSGDGGTEARQEIWRTVLEYEPGEFDEDAEEPSND